MKRHIKRGKDHFPLDTSPANISNPKSKTSARKEMISCSKCNSETDVFPGTQRYVEKLCRDCFGKRQDLRKNELNELSGKQWAEYSRSVEQYIGYRTDKQREHGACYPVSLAEQQIQIYTKRGDVVFDPFMGVGTTAEAAESLGRKSIGIELNKKFAKLAAQDIKDKKSHKIICADAKDMLKHIEPDSIDFVLTSPPYSNLLKVAKGSFAFKWREHSNITPLSNPTPYSHDTRDLGNSQYDDFLNEMQDIMNKMFKIMRHGAYAAWVVKDYRDLKNKHVLVNFHGDIIRIAEKAGLTLWDIKIYDQTKFRPLVVLGYPSTSYYLNIGHSYILVFRKYLNGRYARQPNANS